MIAQNVVGMARKHRILFTIVGFCSMLLLMTVLKTSFASAAACTAPTTDYGKVTGLTTASLPAGTYKIWSRMVAADTTNNTYLLQVDTTCFTVGGSAVKTYTAAQDTANTRFSTSATDTTDWIAASSTITFTTAGTHTLTLIGNAPNVVVDRVILTQDQVTAPQGKGDNVANPPDPNPPVSNITATVSGSTVTVNDTSTDDSGIVSKVELYVDNATTPAQTDISSPFSFTVTGLAQGTHFFTVQAYDPTGNHQPSNSVSVVIPDTTDPTIALTYPTAGVTVAGTIIGTVTAADNVGVTKVEYHVDQNTTPIATGTTAPFSASIDTSTLSNGTHQIAALAFDAAGNNHGTAWINITVSNTASTTDTTPPTVTISAPPTNATLSKDLTTTNFTSSTYKIVALASDASGIKSVAFKVDGTAVGTAITTAPYSVTLDLTKLTCGSHTVTATATDKATAANATTVSTTFTNTLAADMSTTSDCHVDFHDLSILAGSYGKSGTPGTLGRADANNDGVVDFHDLSILAGSYGK